MIQVKRHVLQVQEREAKRKRKRRETKQKARAETERTNHQEHVEVLPLLEREAWNPVEAVVFKHELWCDQLMVCFGIVACAVRVHLVKHHKAPKNAQKHNGVCWHWFI